MMSRATRVLPLILLLASCGGGDGGGGDVPDPVVQLVKWTPSGDNQTDTVAQLLAKVIRVKVTVDGAVTGGINVHFSGGNLGSPNVLTDANGVATSTWTLSEVAGPQEVTASVDGAVGSPVTFHATALPGPAQKLVMVGGDGNVVDTNHVFPGFAVAVTDTFGNGIKDVWVHWSSTGSIFLTVDSIKTNVDGNSTLFANSTGTPGPVTVTATVDGLVGSPINFDGTVVTAPTQVNVGSNFFSPQNLVVSAGAAVQWVVASGAHTLTPTGAPTFVGTDNLSAGTTYGPVLFNTPGVYQYMCTNHAGMTGSVTVN